MEKEGLSGNQNIKTLIKLGLKAADDETANALAEQIDGLQILEKSEKLFKKLDNL